MESKRVPELRFAGFSGEWEEKELGEVVKITGGATPSKANKAYWGGDIVWLSSQEIKNRYVSTGTYTITEKAVLESTTKVVPAFTPLIVSRSGILARMFPISIPTVDVAINQDIKALFVDKEILDTDFFTNQLEMKEKTILNTIVKTGTTVQSVNMPDFEKLKISIPSIYEQLKVGNTLREMSDYITLQQQELDTLKQTKQGFLQKMFPKEGESVPEIRFPGFSGEWKENKIEDYLLESRIPGSIGSKARKITVKLWGQGVVPKKEVHIGSDATKYYMRKAGQFIYGKLDFLNQAFGIIPTQLDGYESTLDSPAFDITDHINPIFLIEYVSQKQFYLYQGTRANGSRKAKRIHVDIFYNMPILVPSIKEQTQIGNFFKQLDDTIAFHQKELDALKETKKAFLQKMFV